MGEELVTEVPEKGKDRPAGRIVEAGGGLPTWRTGPAPLRSGDRSPGAGMSGQPGPSCVVQGVTSRQVTAQWGGEEPQCKIGVLLAERRACTPCHAVSVGSGSGGCPRMGPGEGVPSCQLSVQVVPDPPEPQAQSQRLCVGGARRPGMGGLPPTLSS